MGRQIGIVGNFTSRGRLISQPFAEVMTLFALKPWRLSCRVITSHNPRLLFLIAPSWRSIAINLVNSIRLLITIKSHLQNDLQTLRNWVATFNVIAMPINGHQAGYRYQCAYVAQFNRTERKGAIS